MTKRCPYHAALTSNRGRQAHYVLPGSPATLCLYPLRDTARFVDPRVVDCKACISKAATAAKLKRKASKQRTATTSRARRILQTYGLSVEDYKRILAAQGGACAICKRVPRRNLDVDHNHHTGEIRGLACGLCNRKLLTAGRHDPIVLRNAAVYLEDPPARSVGPFFVPLSRD